MLKHEFLGWNNACLIVSFCALTAIASHAQIFTTLVQFDGTNGGMPYSQVVQGMDGNIYGTTQYGDSASPNGSVFKLTPSGTLTTMYTFSGGSDGTGPRGLALASSGNFYGTTIGIGRSCTKVNCGTVFEITSKGALTTLHTFESTDGAEPAALTLGIDGNFYGTTPLGGNIKSCVDNYFAGCGTVYKITPTGQFTTLYVFCLQTDCPDGQSPSAPLAQASNGIFYGAASGGGGTTKECGGSGCGTIFQITSAGTFSVLHKFEGTDGEGPDSVIQGSDGELYGTTIVGELVGDIFGGFFKLSPSDTFTSLYDIPSLSDGEYPNAIIQATDGNFYGTTSAGGANDYGTIFELTSAGVFTVLHDFSGADGEVPHAGLLQATDGKFYGTTQLGGIANCSGLGCGTVFSLDMGLPPLVTFVVKAGKVGKTVGILGQGLTGTTSVSFNGIEASFNVRSDTFLTATVPTGATTGYVTVQTPAGTLTSNVVFQVIP
jgi:uncharacterized repeat protein (TIGR03803 family)